MKATSYARSLKSLKIENKAGNVQPRFSVKNRKNNLMFTRPAQKIVGANCVSITHETSCDSSLNASPYLFFAICPHVKTYWMAISSHGLMIPPSYRLNIWRCFNLVKDPKSVLNSIDSPSDSETPSQDLSHVDLLAVEGRRGWVRFQQEGRHLIEL